KTHGARYSGRVRKEFASLSSNISVAGSIVSFFPVRQAMFPAWHRNDDGCPTVSKSAFGFWRLLIQSRKFWMWVTPLLSPEPSATSLFFGPNARQRELPITM